MALDKHWHEDCLKCACCDCRLGEVGSSLFTHSNKILCRRDFLRIFGQHGHCAACKKSIPPYEMVMRANQNAYHMECFACQQCQYRFCVGDRFHLTELHKIVCILCHSEQQQQHQQQQQASLTLSGNHHLHQPYQLRSISTTAPQAANDTTTTSPQVYGHHNTQPSISSLAPVSLSNRAQNIIQPCELPRSSASAAAAATAENEVGAQNVASFLFDGDQSKLQSQQQAMKQPHAAACAM